MTRRLKADIERELTAEKLSHSNTTAALNELRRLVKDHWGKNGRKLAADVDNLVTENRKANERATAIANERNRVLSKLRLITSNARLISEENVELVEKLRNTGWWQDEHGEWTFDPDAEPTGPKVLSEDEEGWQTIQHQKGGKSPLSKEQRWKWFQDWIS